MQPTVPDTARLTPHAEAAEAEAVAQTSPAGRARGWAEAARTWLRAGRPDRVAVALERAEQEAERAHDVTARGVVAAVAAEQALRVGRTRPAVLHAEAAVHDLAEGADDELARALLVLATAREADGGVEVDALLEEAARRADGEGRGVALEIALARASRPVRLGHPGQALRALRQVVSAAEAAGDPVLEAAALTALGRALVDARDYVRARPAHERALALHAALGARPGVVASLGGLGLCKLGTGGTADAVPLLTRAIDGCRATGDLPAEAAWRAHLDHALVLLQRTEWRARELRRFVEVVRALGDEAGTASLLCELGNTLREVRDLEGSAAAHAASLAISEARGDAHAASIDHANLGWTALAADDLDAAHAAFRRALELAAPDAPHRPAVAEILTRLDQRPT